MSRLFLTATLALLVACAGANGAGPRAAGTAVALPAALPTEGRPARVVLVSVAGLTPAAALGHGDDAPEMPTLRALARRGAVADAVATVAPASSYPAHTTLVTGRTPATHGVPADHRLGSKGVRRALYSDASGVRGETLWQLAAADGVQVASFDWPATVGAAIPLLIPDVVPTRRGETWQGLLTRTATPALRAAVERRIEPALGAPGPERDALFVDLACGALDTSPAPRLLLLRLSQTEPALRSGGPHGEPARAAFAQVDAELGRLVACLSSRQPFDATLVVVGDRVLLPVHTTIQPNAALAAAGLAGESQPWSAIARSNGGSAFVYAIDARAALLARRALEEEAERTRAFRIVGADEMIRLGVDPDAWFGLEAEPGFVFGDSGRGPVLRRASALAAAGQLGAAAPPAFVAFGVGIRPALRIPLVHQIDVAPTLAALLGVELPGAEGRPLLGLLALPDVGEGVAPPAAAGTRP